MTRGVGMKNFIIGILLGIVLDPFIDVAKDYIECLKLNAKLKIIRSNAEITQIQNLIDTQMDELYGFNDDYYDEDEE